MNWTPNTLPHFLISWLAVTASHVLTFPLEWGNVPSRGNNLWTGGCYHSGQSYKREVLGVARRSEIILEKHEYVWMMVFWCCRICPCLIFYVSSDEKIARAYVCRIDID